MQTKSDYYVKITLYHKVIYSLSILIMLALVVICIWVQTTPAIHFWKRVVFGILGIISFATAIETLLAIIKTKLVLSKTGIKLVRPYFDLECRWNEIIGLSIQGEELILRCNNDVSITKRPLNKISIWPKDIIPINLFTRKWRKRPNWISDPVLSYIQLYRPDLVNEIFQTMK